jgi:hypothetical protein
LGLVPEPNDLREVPLAQSLRKVLGHYYQERTKEASTRIEEQQNERAVKEARKAFANKRDTK